MARVFTITPGLENMGGLKTGGQGSIYKGRRIGEIITAIKILPTPIYSETADDRNFTAFQNEVAKLKKVNELPNPNIVKILSSGISDTGNFPFIEMEYIEGPDLEELLQLPANSTFTINETLKVAEQLSFAIAHCHGLDVKHGDIKSNNVKYNSETGNYVLLDFGLAIRSDEQRRNSLREAGSIEFMAPEQNTGQMLFQTDIYSFGIILFELLAGTVPFKLKGKGESARNEVRLAHMASPVPNLIELRQIALPASWDHQKKHREMQVPGWLVSMVNKCLEKKPEKRFADGKELHNYIVQQIISRPEASAVQLNQITVRPLLKQDIVDNQRLLKKQLSQIVEELRKKESELETLKELLVEKEAGFISVKSNSLTNIRQASKSKRVSASSFAALLFLALALGAFAMYPIFKKNFLQKAQTDNDSQKRGRVVSNSISYESASDSNNTKENNHVRPTAQSKQLGVTLSESTDSVVNPSEEFGKPVKEAQKTTVASGDEKPVEHTNENDEEAAKQNDHGNENPHAAKNTADQADETNDNSNSGKNAVSKKYLVVAKAYFYNEPNEDSKRNEFISATEKAVVQGLNERYGFIYVVITNPQGQVFKGWLRKKELKLYSIE